MKIAKWLILAILLSAFIPLLAGDGVHEKLPPAEYKAKMTAEQGVLLDVRTPKEYEEGHLAGAENINFYDEDFSEKMKSKDKNATYYIYCRSGGRSGKTLAMMKDAGFKKVYDLAGGVIAWNKAELPLEK